MLVDLFGGCQVPATSSFEVLKEGEIGSEAG